MRDTGAIDAARYAAAIELPVALPEARGRGRAAYYTEMIRQELYARYGGASIYHAGLAVETTLDLELQAVAEQALETHLREIEEKNRYPYLYAAQPLRAGRFATDSSASAAAPAGRGGGDRARDRRDPRAGRRARLRRERLQSRGAGEAAARLLLQALHLRRGAARGLPHHRHPARRTGLVSAARRVRDRRVPGTRRTSAAPTWDRSRCASR